MNLSNLTDDELLRMLDGSKHLLSPIIDTLYDRLLSFVDKKPRDSVNEITECPICQASVMVEYDPCNEIYSLVHCNN